VTARDIVEVVERYFRVEGRTVAIIRRPAEPAAVQGTGEEEGSRP
jgi:hypothetical protein